MEIYKEPHLRPDVHSILLGIAGTTLCGLCAGSVGAFSICWCWRGTLRECKLYNTQGVYVDDLPSLCAYLASAPPFQNFRAVVMAQPLQ